MKAFVFKCDGCRIQKGESNHWFVITASPEFVKVEAWSDKKADLPGAVHLCGSACVLKFVSGWLAQ